jgi:hypothetical protein
MKALHSKASFEQAMSALLDQYDRSAKDRGASTKPRR